MVRHQRRLLFVVGLMAALLGVLAYRTEALDSLERQAVDARFSVRGAEPAPKDLVVVTIDERTEEYLNRRFPFPRRFHARALERIARDRPKVIAYDVEFSVPTTVRDDNALINAIGHARPVVLAATKVNAKGESNVLGGGDLLRQLGARAASVSFHLDPGGVFRHLPYEVDGLEHFAPVAVEVADHKRVAQRDIGGDDAWIDYLGPPGTVHTVSFADVLAGRVPAGAFRDKIVVVGASVPTLQDLHPTPTTGSRLMTGSEILANAIDTVRRGAPLRDAPEWLGIVTILALALATPLLGLRLSPLRAIGAALLFGVLYLVAVQLAFNDGHMLLVSYPIAALLVAAAGGLAVHYLGATVERERTRDLFARFVPEPVVGEVLARTDGELRLGGDRRDATVLFSDLRGFTKWAERRRPDEVIEVLNRYLGSMSDAILDHGGTLVAYMGDGIMAVFGAPLEQPDHADRALAAAREMLFERLPKFNESLGADGLGDGFRMGIGLNSGPVMSGNVGSKRRVEYAAVGDTTNTAARLEALTKDTPHQLLLSEETRSRLIAEVPDLTPVDELAVRGREQSVRAWTLAQS